MADMTINVRLTDSDFVGDIIHLLAELAAEDDYIYERLTDIAEQYDVGDDLFAI